MDDVYPRGPIAVPQSFTQATSSYRLHAWLAMAGLAAFVLLYFALAGWFAWTAWRLLAGAVNGGDNAMWGFVAGVSAAFLAVFMLKALFFVTHRYEIDDLEITAQPALRAPLEAAGIALAPDGKGKLQLTGTPASPEIR